jgi:hypothetical protein
MDPMCGVDSHEWDLRYLNWNDAFQVPLRQNSAVAAPISQVGHPVYKVMAVSAEPQGANDLIQGRLPAILARTLSPEQREQVVAAGLGASTGLPIWTWSSAQVLEGELAELTFLGWRHIVFSGSQALFAVDLVSDDGELAFKKASWGKSVPATAAALTALAMQEPEATEVGVLEVPCLATLVLSYKNPGGQGMFMTGFAPFPEFDGNQILQRDELVERASAKAAAEQVTNRV